MQQGYSQFRGPSSLNQRAPISGEAGSLLQQYRAASPDKHVVQESAPAQTLSAFTTARKPLTQHVTLPPDPLPPMTIPSAPLTPDRQRKRRIILIDLGIGSLILLSIVGFWLWSGIHSATDVTIYQVGVRSAQADIGGGGVIFPHQQFDLSYPATERVMAVLVKAGDHVTAKQELLRLDPAQLNAQVQQAANNMSAAEAYLQSVSASGNRLSMAQAQQQYDYARNRYNALVAQSSSPFLQNGTLIAPMNGVVTTVKVNPGEVFAADTTLLTIMDEEDVIVRVKIPLFNLGQVYIGQQTQVTPSALPGASLAGTVSSIIPQADPQTDTFEVWVDVKNADKTLLPGMSAFVRIHTTLSGLIVPRLAVLHAEKNASVFVLRNQHVYLQYIQLAGRVGDTLLVSDGLTSGDKIVLLGLDTLTDGQAVRVRSMESSIG